METETIVAGREVIEPRTFGGATGDSLALRLLQALVCVSLFSLAGCALVRSPVNPTLIAAAASGDALTVSDTLEGLIAAGRDTTGDREFAYEEVRKAPGMTAAQAFARAAVAGRVVQSKGLLGAPLLGDVEESARHSRDLDPSFRNGAATRLLGTLYVMAPAKYLRHGNSETGIDLLEELTAQRPDILENHLRLAEAYVALSDSAPAIPHLCQCSARKTELRQDDQQLLAHLIEEVGAMSCEKPR
jgi:hypothetical protein